MAGVDLYTVKEILGHKTLVMTQRYSHLSPEHQRQAVERLVPAEPVHASATDPFPVPAASATDGAGEITTEKKWWTGGELNSRHQDCQSGCIQAGRALIRKKWSASAEVWAVAACHSRVAKLRSGRERTIQGSIATGPLSRSPVPPAGDGRIRIR